MACCDARASNDGENGLGVAAINARRPGGVHFNDKPSPPVNATDVENDRGRQRDGRVGRHRRCEPSGVFDLGRLRRPFAFRRVDTLAAPEVGGKRHDLAIENERPKFHLKRDRLGDKDRRGDVEYGEASNAPGSYTAAMNALSSAGLMNAVWARRGRRQGG